MIRTPQYQLECINPFNAVIIIMNHRIKLLYLGLAALLIYTLWPSESDHSTSSVYEWNLKTSAQGEVEVFGIAIGKHTLKQAENTLKSRSERALFLPSDNSTKQKPSIEAFFQQMPDNSKLVIGLTADDSVLSKLKPDAYNPIAFPSGNIKLKIADRHNDMLDQLVVRMITYVPRIRLNPQDIMTRFGEPDQVWMEDDVYHYLYPAKGLDAILHKSGEGIIQFVSPKEFHLVLEQLKKTATPVKPVATGTRS